MKAAADTHVLPAWHAVAEEDVLRMLDASEGGLSAASAAARLRKHGRNILPAKKPPSAPVIFLRQFLSPLIYILLAAGVVSVFIGDSTDAAFIVAIVTINAGLGAFQEWKAERSAAGLQQLLRIKARVDRDGSTVEIAAEELVPGDIVHLESGGRVPADLRLLEANGLKIDESLLTGESLAVEKITGALPEEAAVSDRRNMAFAGSAVSSGRGIGAVVATGLRTEVGAIARTVTASEPAKPPLVIRMEKLARQVSVVVVGACALLGFIAAAQGTPVIEVFFMAVALAVSAIPEGLPVAMTVALSIAARRMARRNVIVRKLTAVEGLGSCTFIASDKTGTLTVNRQIARALWLPADGRIGMDDGPVAPLTSARARAAVMPAVISNEAGAARHGEEWRFSGDAVDVALWELAAKLGVDPASFGDEIAAIGEIPYESERGFSARFYRRGGETRVAVKGAPEVVLALCAALDAATVERELFALLEDGYRVIAIAEGRIERPLPDRTPDERDLSPLTLTALAGMIDPARPEAAAAVAKCRQAGIQVAMVTGDHPLTALAIAREVGIADSAAEVLSGKQLAEAGVPGSPQYFERIRPARVFARVTPLQKVEIVEAQLRLGHFIAVTGDGVNDAPALKRANIGVAMGSGTDVAKETASIIVADDNFASIEAGVEEGRFAYDNIRKVTYLLLSTGAAEIMLVVLALLSDLPLPLLPAQLLWLNLVTNGIQDIGLAFEAGEEEAIRRPPRSPAEGVFNRLMIQQTALSGVSMGLIAFVNYYALFAVMGFGEFEARNRLLLLMVLLENYHVFNCRSEYASAFKIALRRNWFLVGGVFAAQGIHILAMHAPVFQRLLRVGPISLGEWAVPFAIASLILIVMEAFKYARPAPTPQAAPSGR